MTTSYDLSFGGAGTMNPLNLSGGGGYSMGTLGPSSPASVAATAVPSASNMAYGPSPSGAAPASYAPQVGAPGIAQGASAVGGQGFWGGLGLWGDGGLNWNNMGSLAQGLGSLAGIWNAFQQNKIAREQLDFTKEAFNENLDNSIQTYNTNLEGLTHAEYAQEGRSRKLANRYISAHSLARD